MALLTQYAGFFVSPFGEKSVTDELNAFLRSHCIVNVDKKLIVNLGYHMFLMEKLVCMDGICRIWVMGLIEKSILNKEEFMQINIGADELILWLRKNKKAIEVENSVLGRRIITLIKELDGQPIEEDHKSIWADDMSDVAMARLGLPITSEQYKIDTKILPDIYEKLLTW
jgi:hypothetical protein